MCASRRRNDPVEVRLVMMNPGRVKNGPHHAQAKRSLHFRGEVAPTIGIRSSDSRFFGLHGNDLRTRAMVREGRWTQ
jgi:hypothetical protein